MAHKSAVSDELAGALGPNESGIVALAKSGDLVPLKDYMPTSTKVRTAGVDDATAVKLTEEASKSS